MSELERIRSELNIESFDKLTNEQMKSLLESVGRAKYTVDALREIAPMVPHFASMANEAVKNIYQMADLAKTAQANVLESLNQSMKLLDKIASHPNADKEVLMRVVEKASEITKAILEVSRSWSDVFKEYGRYAVMIGGVAISVVGAIAFGGRSNRA